MIENSTSDLNPGIQVQIRVVIFKFRVRVQHVSGVTGHTGIPEPVASRKVLATCHFSLFIQVIFICQKKMLHVRFLLESCQGASLPEKSAKRKQTHFPPILILLIVTNYS